MSYTLRKVGRIFHARIQPPGGGKRIERSTRCTTERNAHAVARRWDREIATGSYLVTLEEAFQRLADHKVDKGVSKATLEILECKARHVVQWFGKDCDVRDIGRKDTTAYVRARRADVSDSTIEKELRELRAALYRLKIDRLYADDPAALWPDILRQSFDPRTRWLTFDEYRAMLEALPPRWRDHLTVHVYTGVRASELYALEARAVSDRRLWVEGTKTANARRWVPLHAAVLPVALRMRRSARLFEPVADVARDKRAFDRALKRAADKARVAPVSANDLRRTFATWCRDAGISKDDVRDWMGHTTSALLDRVYAQINPGRAAPLVDRLPGE